MIHLNLTPLQHMNIHIGNIYFENFLNQQQKKGAT
jgi:hypothetical protein